METHESAHDSEPARRAGASCCTRDGLCRERTYSGGYCSTSGCNQYGGSGDDRKSLVIKGEVTGSESLYIDGRVEGSINLSGNRVTVGRNGVVSANINAREIVVLGKVRGNLTASDRVDIRSDGSLTGDVVAARISIEDGAFFKGGIDIRKAGQKANGEEVKTSGSTETATAARV